jgi:hypothetical protein
MVTNNALNNLTGLMSMQVFTTPGANTWTKPAGINKVLVMLVGGGGGGGGVDANTGQLSVGSNGSGGGYSQKLIDVTAIASETVTIGAAGAGGAAGANNGAQGGTTSFGAHCQATGGFGGTSKGPNTVASDISTISSAGVGSGGDINLSGGSGAQQYIAFNGTNAVSVPSPAGSSMFGYGTRSPSLNSSGASVAGVNATTASYGAGGSGALAYNNTTDRAGGNGSSGICIVYEYA